jgi:predicted cobalt transporter CbtA
MENNLIKCELYKNTHTHTHTHTHAECPGTGSRKIREKENWIRDDGR